MDIVSYALSKKYTDNSIEGTSGALAGKNCQIQSEVQIEGGRRITFAWYKDGETAARTTTVDVMDGERGAQGVPGDDGFSPEITVKQADLNTYILHIVTDDVEFDTPNLKGSGGGMSVSAANDVLIFSY